MAKSLVFPKAKYFSGERYTFHDDYLVENKAQWEAQKLRADGWKARVVVATRLRLYGVYKRRK